MPSVQFTMVNGQENTDDDDDDDHHVDSERGSLLAGTGGGSEGPFSPAHKGAAVKNKGSLQMVTQEGQQLNLYAHDDDQPNDVDQPHVDQPHATPHSQTPNPKDPLPEALQGHAVGVPGAPGAPAFTSAAPAAPPTGPSRGGVLGAVSRGIHYDVHCCIEEDGTVAAMHGNAEVFDAATEDSFRYLQVWGEVWGEVWGGVWGEVWGGWVMSCCCAGGGGASCAHSLIPSHSLSHAHPSITTHTPIHPHNPTHNPYNPPPHPGVYCYGKQLCSWVK